MSEALLYQECGRSLDVTAAAAYTGGEVLQAPDSSAGRVPVDVASGALASVDTDGILTLQKTASIAILAGGDVFWDHSANVAHFKPVNDRDFYVGRCVEDSSESATTVRVRPNRNFKYGIDLKLDAALSVPTGTQAVGAFGFPKQFGGSKMLELTATSEAQCIDLLSVDKFSVSQKGIAEFVIRPVVNGSGAAVDFNVGLANGTHASDADAITEHCFFHIDGASLAINAQSKDGTTTVAAVDTTKVITAGSAVANRSYLWIDFRDSTNVKLYVDGVRVNSGSTFKLNAATGPLGLLAHLEKTTGTTTAQFSIDEARVRFVQQAP